MVDQQIVSKKVTFAAWVTHAVIRPLSGLAFHGFSRVTLLTASLAAVLLVLGPGTASAWVFGNNDSYTNSECTSADGRYVAFSSDASNLVANDTNGLMDVFRLDTQTGAVVRVSVDSSGNQGVGPARSRTELPAISADGTKIAFQSDLTNLVAGDTNASRDVFLRDITAGTTVRVSVTSSGGQATSGRSSSPSISGDGTKVAFSTEATLIPEDTNGQQDIYVRDLSAGTTVRTSVDSSGNQVAIGGSYNPSISSDGTKVAFDSGAATFVADDTNEHSDIFVRDLSAGTTVRVSVDSSGNQTLNNGLGVGGSGTPSFNSDGTKVAFSCDANNLVPGDNNGVMDVFVRDLSAGTTVRANVDSSGNQGTGGASYYPSISSDGTKVAFQSDAKNLVLGDNNNVTDVFVRDFLAGTTVRASVDSSGNQANNYSELPSISADGTRVAFRSVASNLVSGDTNGRWDVFVYDLTTNATSVPVTLSGFGLE